MVSPTSTGALEKEKNPVTYKRTEMLSSGFLAKKKGFTLVYCVLCLKHIEAFILNLLLYLSDFTCTPPYTVFLKYRRVWEKIEMIFSFAGVFLPTSFHHAHFVTLPKTTGLAALPPIPVYSTLIGCWAHIVIVT